MNNPYFSFPLVLVDLETTGANPQRDRITEVGIVQIDEQGSRSWSRLVNPEQAIPEFIQELTGISNEMVADAPLFAEIATDVLDLLQGRVFVAHNARFDYGFLKQEFKRLDMRLQAQVLCTVKLSRKLYPNEHKHSLDALIARYGLTFSGGRHRALTDAELLQQFLEVALKDHGADVLHQAIAELLRQPALPPALDPAQIDELPESSGVYIFYGHDDVPLYIGKNHNIRKRVLAHFSDGNPKEVQLAKRTQRLAWHETSGELGALLLETSLVSSLEPSYNPPQRRIKELGVWRLVEKDQVLQPYWTPWAEVGSEPVFGPFRSRREAANVLNKMIDGHGLCRQILGLEPKPKSLAPCSAFLEGRCRGACVGRDLTHNARFAAAMDRYQFPAWPYQGAVALAEGPEWAPVLQVFDQWCYLGAINSLAELPALLAKPRKFELDVFKLIQKEFKKRVRSLQMLGSGVESQKDL
ncbi:exonuclease domain-containing protein [Iodobacter sp. CM08]|uniref:exonuclease domain-containing protein n=1 Tax=Iodobacter sp. CM08 TaxID=3085902 RepID=UPI002982796D|nr:exonuclease domain-containing protein [Iodobacter sp. CM08]MDW5417011.1 exonuclease domain-containing protein [Iodobacter sp. CM08]